MRIVEGNRSAVVRAKPILVGFLLVWSWGLLAVTYCWALVGVRNAVRRHRLFAVLLVVSALALTAASSGYQANARFRLPILPYVVLLCSYATRKPMPRAREKIR